MMIDGLAVMGGLGDLERLLDEQPSRVSAVIVAIGELSQEKFERVCAICAERGVAVRRMRFALDEVKRHASPGKRVVGFPRQ